MSRDLDTVEIDVDSQRLCNGGERLCQKYVSVIFCQRKANLAMEGKAGAIEDKDEKGTTLDEDDTEDDETDELMEFKQMKKKKKKQETAASQSGNQSQNNSQSGSQHAAGEPPRSSSRLSGSKEPSKAANVDDNGDQDTENDAASLSSIGNSNPASPIPHESGDNSYTSGSEYTSADESYTYSEDGVDSFVVANLERNELKNRVIELEENLRGKQAVLKDLNKENYELRAKLQSYQSGSRQESTSSPVLRKELESVQETLRQNQKRLEEIDIENHEMRTKLAHTNHDDKSTSSKIEEMKLSLDSKQQMLEALNFQNQELIKENNVLKSRLRERSPDNSQSDSQVESLQESLRAKQTVLSELNKQNQELREKIQDLSQSSVSDGQMQSFKRRISDLQSEIGLKDDEIERLKAIEISFVQTKEMMKELSLQSNQAKQELENAEKRYENLQTDSEAKERELLDVCKSTEKELEKVQSEYHNIVAINNDHLMKIQILEGQIATLDEKLNEKEKRIAESDTQVSLAVGERDAVQLEARAQVEDFEEKIKMMQDQLQKNGSTLKDYEAEISQATTELECTKNLVLESERMLEMKNQEISMLEKKLESFVSKDSQFSNERVIYTEEIETLKRKIEEDQIEIRALGTKLHETQTHSHQLISQKEIEIVRLEKEKEDLEKIKAEEVGNMQSHFDRIFEEKTHDSNQKMEDEMKRLEVVKQEEIKRIEDEYETKLMEMKEVFEKNKKAEIAALVGKFEMEQKAKIEEVQKQLTDAIVQQGAEETKIILKDCEDRISKYEALVASKDKELDDFKVHVSKLEDVLSERQEELSRVKEESGLGVEEKERLLEDLTKRFEESEAKVKALENTLSEMTVQAENSSNEIKSVYRQKEELVAESGKELSNVKQEYEDKLRLADIEVMNLKNSNERDKAEFLQFMNEVEILKEKLSASIESENQLRLTLSELEKDKRDTDELLQEWKDQQVELENGILHLKQENIDLKGKIDEIEIEKKSLISDHLSEVEMLNNRMEVMKSENNNEMTEKFNQMLDKLKQDKDEQIRSLKEEISHVKDGNEKYTHKMQKDFECDMKHVEDENQSLRMQLKDMKESKEKDKTSRDSDSLKEMEAMQEKHKLELADVKETIQKRFEEELLRLKENQWQQLKRYESERDLEIKRLTEDSENSKREAVEVLRQQMEEERHQEVHDVLCSMTKEQKEAVSQIKAEMERQLKRVQEERDTEIRNIQKEYQSSREGMKQEMEELLASQIARYQEEQETLQKKLHRAEGKLRKISSEKEELTKQLESKGKDDSVGLEEKLKDAEMRLDALGREKVELERQMKNEGDSIDNEILKVKENEEGLGSVNQEDVTTPLKILLDDLRSEIQNLSSDGDVSVGQRRSDVKLYEDRSGEDVESSLDRELSEITRLCKGQIVDLAYKLKIMKNKYDSSEKTCHEVSNLNQSLKEELFLLESKLQSNKDELNKSYEVNENLKGANNMLQAEVEGLNNEKEELKQSFDILDGKEHRLPEEETVHTSKRLAEISTEIEAKLKEKEILDQSLTEIKSEINQMRNSKTKRELIFEEDVSVLSVRCEEVAVVPQFLEELETVPLEEVDGSENETKIEKDEAAPKEALQATSVNRDLELKHLQKLLMESSEKHEDQKMEIKELREALENERAVFAEQLRARVAKDTEVTMAQSSAVSEASLREKRDLVNRTAMLESKLKEKERTESELKDENWRLVNLLKDSSIELYSEKESLQDQLEKQEDIIKELQEKMSTSDLVTNELQEAFGRQLAALHRQRDALLEQLEQHKRNHQGYAKVLQEKATLEDRLREEKKILSEKLRQKEALEMELAAERAALNEKLIELEKLREMLNGKEKLADELTGQRDELKMELSAIEERLRIKEEDLGVEREELEREHALKDYELKKWEDDFRARENELLEHEESLRENFTHILESTRTDLETRNEENLRQLRTDLDTDYRSRLSTTEEGLHNRYGQQISRLQEEHENQMNRAKSGFEERLLDLRRQLDEERLRQVRTVKEVLEREHSREKLDLQASHDMEVDGLRSDQDEGHRYEMERLRREFEISQRNVMEDLQATLITESAIRVGAARVAAEQELEHRLREMQSQMDNRLEEKMKDMEEEKEAAIKEVKEEYDKELREKVDEVMRDMQAEKEAELEKVMNDASNDLQERIRLMENQVVNLRDPQRVQARMELDNRHENEIIKAKTEFLQKCGDDDEIIHTLREFETVQEDYFKEVMNGVQEEHEIQMANILKDCEISALKMRNEFEMLREDDFQRIRRLQDEIYAKEETILEMRKTYEEEVKKMGQELTEEKHRFDKEMARKIDEQIAIVAKEKEVWEADKEREIAFLKSQFEGGMIEKEAENEEKLRNCAAWYQNEMQRKEMEFIQREEIMKENLGQRAVQAQFQAMESQYAEQLQRQDYKHREELEQAVVQLSTNLKEDFNKVMADMRAKSEEEKAQMRKDFSKVKRDALDDLREELAADYNIQLKEMKAELEHKKVTEIAEVTTQISLKNAMDLENLRKNLSEKYEKEIDDFKREMQEDFHRNAMRQAEEMEEMEIRHFEELRRAKRTLDEDEIEDIRRAVQEDFAVKDIEQAKQMEELERIHAEELKRLREKYEADEVQDARQEMQNDVARNMLRLAMEMEELEMKHADENKRLRQKYERDEVDGIRQGIVEDRGKRSAVYPEQHDELMMKHEENLKQVKHKYEKVLNEKTHELQSEIDVLRSLLKESENKLRKVSRDDVDAIPSAPPIHYIGRGSAESLIVPAQRFSTGVTPSSSTETLIARFADGEVVNALNDALQDISSDDASRTGTSLSGSLPSLFQHAGARYPANRYDMGRDEVEQNREAVVREMRRRFRPSDSDSGKSYDQMMEPLIEEDERVNKLLREKEEEKRHQLEKLREEYENVYQGRMQELERENAQMEEYIHHINFKHEQEMNALKEKSLQLADKQLKEVREEASIEKAEMQQQADDKMEKSKLELMEKHEKMLKKFMKQQDDLTQELKNEHIEQLGMLKHELTMQHERQVKEVERKQGEYLLQTRDRYEKLLKTEREKFERKHAEDAKKLKLLMEKSLADSQNDLVEVLKTQYEVDLKRIRSTLEDDKRRAIDELTHDHMADVDRAKENLRREMTEKHKAEIAEVRENARQEYDEYMRRDLTEKVIHEIERAREDVRREYEELHSISLRDLENQLEETHIEQIKTLQNEREQHKTAIDEMKRKHEEEIDNIEKSYEEKYRSLKDSLQEERISEMNAVELSLEKDVDKIKEELEEAHNKEIEQLKHELISANAKLVALEEVKSGTEKTYVETIKTLHEDYENEISKLKEAIESIREKQLESQDRNVLDIYNTDQRIIKQNFEQQISQMKEHYEMLMNDMERKFESEKRKLHDEYTEKHEKKMDELKKSYEEERKELHNEMIAMDDESARNLDSLMDKVKSLTAELNSTRKEAKQLREENVELENRAQVTNDQYNTLVSRHERQEEENSKYVKMISGDVEKCEQEKSNMRNANERLLQTLSNAVRASVLIEDVINRHLDILIQETSRTESGVDVSGNRGGARGGGHRPDSNRSFRFFGSSPSKSKKDKTFGDSTLADVTQYSNLSGGSLLSDEGLDLSFISKEKLFSGSELEANGEEIVRGVSERLHTAVEHLLKMLSVSTRQTSDIRQAYDDAMTRTNEAEQEQSKLREEIAENLKKALEDLEKEGKLKTDWEKEARKKHSELQAAKSENEEMKIKIDELTKENKNKNKDTRTYEERCVELEAVNEVLTNCKRDLEVKLAESRTHLEKEVHKLKRENRDLEDRLSKAVHLSGDDLHEVLSEIEELKEMVDSLSEEKEALRSQLMDAKANVVNSSKETERLRLDISEALQNNIDLAHQNEALRKKNKSLESAFEETLEEKRLAEELAATRQEALDDVDGISRATDSNSRSKPSSPGGKPSSPDGKPSSPDRVDGPSSGDDGSPNDDLREEIQNLKEIIESLKEKNDALCGELDHKVETELELLNKISELEDDLYRSANEGFESEREDRGVLLQRRRSVELNFKLLANENEKLKVEIHTKEAELEALEDDLRKAKELLADKENIFEELSSTKSILAEKSSQFSQVNSDRSLIKHALAEKEQQLSAISSELYKLKETVEDQQLTIDNQQKKILDLLEKQDSEDLREQYVRQLEHEIEKEKVMVLEKDGEIQALLDKLNAKRSEGDGEDAQAKTKRVKDLEEKIAAQKEEIKKLTDAIKSAEEEREELEEKYKVNLQKTIHHVKKEMEQKNNEKIAELKEEHQADIDRMLEVSRIEMSELGQRFEEQVGAAERVNLQLLEHFFKNRTSNESQLPVNIDQDTPVESLLNELQIEAEKIAQLVTSYQINADDPLNVQELQNSWAKEKQILLEAVKALRELVSRASNAAASDAVNVGEDWRAGLLRAVEKVFTLDSDLLNVEIETLESIPSAAERASDEISTKRKRLVGLRKSHSQILNSLTDEERESYLQEIAEFRAAVEELSKQAEKYKELIEEARSKAETAELRESNLTFQYDSQTSLVEKERVAAAELKTKLENERSRNLELEALIKEERNAYDDLKKAAETDEEKIRDLVNSLENERKELKQIRSSMAKEQSTSQNLAEQVKTEKQRSTVLEKELAEERKRLEEISSKEESNLHEMENLLSNESERCLKLAELVDELTEEKSRIMKAAELDQAHASKIEGLCEELKSKAAQEKNERQRLEKIAERYHANLEEMRNLFEEEKKRRIENETALKEQRESQSEAEEKGQHDASEKQKLQEMIGNLKNELDRAEAKIASQDAEMMSLKSKSALEISEIKKEHAERLSETVAKSKRDSADEVERERATSKQLRDQLRSLELKYETSRSQYERMRESIGDADENQQDKEHTPKSSPRSPSSRALYPFMKRCNKLVTHCQDVIANEQQRMTYGADRPSERHIKELQSTHDALAALVQELNQLQQDLQVLEQDDQSSNSPLARLEQAHTKNEEYRDHIRKLVKEKSEFRKTLTYLEEQVMEYRKREAELEEAHEAGKEAKSELKSEQLKWEAERSTLKSDLLRLEAERDALEQALNKASLENANLKNSPVRSELDSHSEDNADNNKLAESGWSLQKIQKLYGRCLRAESFRKALIYQKKYLLFLLGGYQETEAITLSMIAKMNDVTHVDGTRKEPYGKSRAFMRFRTAARVVIATWRMKFLVRKWSKSTSKITLKSTKKSSSGTKSSPSAPSELVIDKSDQYHQSKPKSGREDRIPSKRSGDLRHNRVVSNGTESKHSGRISGKNDDSQSSEQEFETRRRRQRGNDNVTTRPRRERSQKTDSESNGSSYAAVKDLDRSPPRAYPRPASPRLSRESPPVLDSDYRYYKPHSSGPSPRSRSPASHGPSPNRKLDTPSKHQRSLSASGLDETNTSLNAYIKKLEMLQARLKSQETDSTSETRRF